MERWIKLVVAMFCGWAVTRVEAAGAGTGDVVFQWPPGPDAHPFNGPGDAVEVPWGGALDRAAAASVSAWFLLKRPGEQIIVGRGLPETGPNGERIFRRADDRVRFFLGVDQHGFLMGCLNGNSRMPFPLVTLSEVTSGDWHHAVVVKHANGEQRFYHNGTMVYSDVHAAAGGKAWPFVDSGSGEPVRFAMSGGGAIAEVVVHARARTAEDVRSEWESKRSRFTPHRPVEAVALRPIHEWSPARPMAESPEDWARQRAGIAARWRELLGRASVGRCELAAHLGEEVDAGSHVRRKGSIQVQAGDRMPFWLLVPRAQPNGRRPAIICLYGTTAGAGKDTTVGLSGPAAGTPPERNRSFAIDVVEAGFIALAPDLLRDGERVPPSGRPYDTSAFYQEFPEWSCVGKDCHDISRAIDYLQSIPQVDPERIGVVGHSYGGHTAIFAASLDDRLKTVFASGPVSEFEKHGLHWAVPKGAAASQSLPGLRPYLLENRRPPVSFAEVTALVAPRPLAVNQAVGEWRPNEEQNAALVSGLYRTIGREDSARFTWCAGDHDFPPEARFAAVAWLRRWLR